MVKQLQRRYQFWGPDGIQWTNWYNVGPDRKRDPWELKGKLKAEYREI